MFSGSVWLTERETGGLSQISTRKNDKLRAQCHWQTANSTFWEIRKNIFFSSATHMSHISVCFDTLLQNVSNRCSTAEKMTEPCRFGTQTVILCDAEWACALHKPPMEKVTHILQLLLSDVVIQFTLETDSDTKAMIKLHSLLELETVITCLFVGSSSLADLTCLKGNH